MNKEFIVRRMTEDEVINIAVKWAAAEGWNPGLNDGHCFYNTDPNGFFIGLLDGVPIACISAVAYDNNFGFLGFYIVKPEYRGQGYGLKIWNTAIDYLKNHNVGLDGVIEQQPNYKKSGFSLAYKNIRYEGKSFRTNDSFPEIVKHSDVSNSELLRYDAALFPAQRNEFHKSWLEMPDSHSFASVSDGKISGYTVIRKCLNGYKIGPLFADSKELAEKLFLTVNSLITEGSSIYLDTPDTNKDAVNLALKYGMQIVFETARMYTKFQPDFDINRVFGVTTFELG
jgi:GNAT superfamily N-acetyltransferase